MFQLPDRDTTQALQHTLGMARDGDGVWASAGVGGAVAGGQDGVAGSLESGDDTGSATSGASYAGAAETSDGRASASDDPDFDFPWAFQEPASDHVGGVGVVGGHGGGSDAAQHGDGSNGASGDTRPGSPIPWGGAIGGGAAGSGGGPGRHRMRVSELVDSDVDVAEPADEMRQAALRRPSTSIGQHGPGLSGVIAEHGAGSRPNPTASAATLRGSDWGATLRARLGWAGEEA